MKKSLWKPDFVMATLAVVIGICTMVVYIYQARVMSKQLHTSVWPYVEVISSQGNSGISIGVSNKGAGPAIIKTNRIVLDGKAHKENKLDSVLELITGRKIARNYTTVESRVMAAGEHFNFVEINDRSDMLALHSALRMHTLEIEVCYCSIYDDCWKIVNGKNTECDSCD
jgi:hypothetical protein